MYTLKEFGIQLQPSSDSKAATRLINDDYHGNDLDAQRTHDIDILVKQHEDWAAVYNVIGGIDESEKLFLLDRLQKACEYFLKEPARCEMQEQAMQKYQNDIIVYTALPFVKIQQVADLDSRHEFIQSGLVYKDIQSIHTRTHYHRAIDAQASLERIYNGVITAQHQLKN